MGKADFFDDFTTNIVLSADCISKLNAVLLNLVESGSAAEEGVSIYSAAVHQVLAAQGVDLQAALQDNPGFIYLEAATDMQKFEELLSQTAAAAQCATKAAAEAAAAKAQGQEEVPGSWEPPPADVHPETDEDYA